MTQIIISNLLRDAISAFTSDKSAILSDEMENLTALMSRSDEIDAEIAAIETESEKVKKSIQHYQERTRLFAIEKAELTRIADPVKDEKEEAIKAEEERAAQARALLKGLR